MTTTIDVPHQYKPRSYQRSFYNCLADGFKRGVAIWHRRAGKDLTALNMTIKESLKRIGAYFLFFPTYAQGKKIVWDGFDYQGRRFLTYFPSGTKFNHQEMKAVLPWGSHIQIIGTDKFDRIVGPNPFGCVFSEWALQDARVLDLIRPILRENDGWALFLYTPRGKNHGWDTYQLAKQFPGRWFLSFLDITMTKRDDGTPVISEEDIEQDRQDGMSEDMVQQEYYCSFELGIEGSYYGKLMIKVDREGRIVPDLYDDSVSVKTAWDFGVGDAGAIWFFQLVGNHIRLINYFENVGWGVKDYIQLLGDMRGEHGYTYSEHFAPHDVDAREKFAGRSIKDQAGDLDFNFTTVPKDVNIQSGIEAVRGILPRCWFDEKKTLRGRACLENYRKEYNLALKAYSNKPLHDWASHGADAFRTLADALKAGVAQGKMLTPARIEEYTRLYGQQSTVGGGPLDL